MAHAIGRRRRFAIPPISSDALRGASPRVDPTTCPHFSPDRANSNPAGLRVDTMEPRLLIPFRWASAFFQASDFPFLLHAVYVLRYTGSA
jgi:hypothetical protein